MAACSSVMLAAIDDLCLGLYLFGECKMVSGNLIISCSYACWKASYEKWPSSALWLHWSTLVRERASPTLGSSLCLLSCWVRSWSLGILQRGCSSSASSQPTFNVFHGLHYLLAVTVTDRHIIQTWLLQASSGRFPLPWPWCTLIAFLPLVMAECSSFSSCMFSTDPKWAPFLVSHRFLFVSLCGSKFLPASFSSVCRSCLTVSCGAGPSAPPPSSLCSSDKALLHLHFENHFLLDAAFMLDIIFLISSYCCQFFLFRLLLW